MPTFTKKSLERLEEVHPDLKKLFLMVIQHRDCLVTCGWRSKEEQDAAVLAKTTKLAYPKSKHNVYPSYAIDVIPRHAVEPHIRWDDIEAFKELGNFVLGCAAVLEIDIAWGGDWKTFKDYPHYELKSRPALPVYKKPG